MEKVQRESSKLLHPSEVLKPSHPSQPPARQTRLWQPNLTLTGDPSKHICLTLQPPKVTSVTYAQQRTLSTPLLATWHGKPCLSQDEDQQTFQADQQEHEHRQPLLCCRSHRQLTQYYRLSQAFGFFILKSGIQDALSCLYFIFF